MPQDARLPGSLSAWGATLQPHKKDGEGGWGKTRKDSIHRGQLTGVVRYTGGVAAQRSLRRKDTTRVGPPPEASEMGVPTVSPPLAVTRPNSASERRKFPAGCGLVPSPAIRQSCCVRLSATEAITPGDRMPTLCGLFSVTNQGSIRVLSHCRNQQWHESRSMFVT